MEVYVYHDQTLAHLVGEATVLIEDEVHCETTLGKAESLVQTTAVHRSLGHITSEEAGVICKNIFIRYPELRVSLKAELEKGHLG